jgi:hypothetical protein
MALGLAATGVGIYLFYDIFFFPAPTNIKLVPVDAGKDIASSCQQKFGVG